MPNEQVTKHTVIDVKTGVSYGLKLDAEGNCKAIQLLSTSIETVDGRGVTEFSLVKDNPMDRPSLTPPNSRVADVLPYGQTIYAVEPASDSANPQVFTIVWPKREDADKGAKPYVSRKDMSDDLSKSGFAPLATGPNKKGTGVDNEEELNKAMEGIDRMIGLDNAKREIRQNISIARFNKLKEELKIPTKPISRHMVFTGNPGTGKTTFAREVAKAYHALGFIDGDEVHEVKREDLVAGFIGQTAIKTMDEIKKAAKKGVLFIDEAYSLSRDTSSDGKDFGKEAIDTLVAAMENMREKLIVIVAGYPEPMKAFIGSNPGLKSRFLTYIQFDDYGMPQLDKILDSMLEDRGYTMEPRREKPRHGADLGRKRPRRRQELRQRPHGPQPRRNGGEAPGRAPRPHGCAGQEERARRGGAEGRAHHAHARRRQGHHADGA